MKLNLESYGFEVVARAPSAEHSIDNIFDFSTGKACVSFVEQVLDFKVPSAFKIRKFEPPAEISGLDSHCRVTLKRVGHEFIINLTRHRSGDAVRVHIMLALGTSHQLTRGEGRRASEFASATLHDRSPKLCGLRDLSATDLFIRDLMATDR